MGKNDRHPTADELRLWRQAVSGANPGPSPDTGGPPPDRAQRPMGAKPKSRTRSPAPGQLGKHEARAIKRGRLPIDDRIDLHGMTQEQAHRALHAFLLGSREAGRRAVLVITGKGRHSGEGVLRDAVPRWLNEDSIRPMIRAFSHAAPKDGGQGALYVLLKRRK